MIAELAIGTAAVPDSQPGEAVAVVVPIIPPMPSDAYDVTILRPARIPTGDFKVTKQTATEVTVTVTRPLGNAGAVTIHAICTQAVAHKTPAELLAQQAATDALKADVATLKTTVAALVEAVKIKPPK
jgi:hypothetical protein